MYILQYKPNVRTTSLDSYQKMLSIGESYEDALCLELALFGLSDYRPKQRLPKHLLRAYQRDVLVKVGKVKRLAVEVKARPYPWQWADVLVGCCPKWDEKMFPVTAVVVICQNTGDTRVCPGNTEEWLRRKVGGHELSYSVPKRLFTPLDAWVSAMKDQHGI